MAEAFTVRRYQTAWNKLKSILKDRGIETDSVNKSESDFTAAVESGQTMIGARFVKEDDTSQLAILHLGGKMTLKTVGTILEQIAGNRTLIVYQSSITPQARIQLLETKVVELYEEEEFLKLTRPDRVLSVTVLSPEDKQQFLGLFNITEEMVPEGKDNEPLPKYYGLMPGDLAKITEVRDGSRFITFRRIVRN